MSDRLREAFAGAVKRIEERQWIYGLLGRKNSDGTFTFNVPGRRGFLFVTIRNAAGAQTVIPARNDFGVEHRPNLGVRMKLEHGIYVIWGKANRSDLVHTPGSPDYGIPEHPINSHSDIPPYVTNAGKLLAVKATEDGVEWVLVGADVATQTSAADTEDTIDDASLWGRVEGGVWVKTAWSNIKAVLNGLYGRLASTNTWTQVNTFSSRVDTPIVRADSAAGIMVQDDGGNPGLFVADGGNVMVGPGTPGAKLDINGSFRAIGTSTAPSASGVGQGVELWYWTGSGGPYGLLLAFDRDAGTYKPLRIAGDSIGFEIGATRRMTLTSVGLGVGVTSPQGKAHIDQDSTTAAVPVLILDQADLSEEMIQFDTTVGAGNPVDTAALGTYYGKVRVSVNGTFKYIPLYNS